MKTRIFLIMAAALGVFKLNAQTLRIQGRYPAGNVEQLALHICPLANASTAKGVELKPSDKTFEGEVPVSANGFYLLYGRNGDIQLMLPVYLPETKGAQTMTLRMEQGCPRIEEGKDNKALAAFYKSLWNEERFFWMQGKTLKNEEVLSFLRSYQIKADSIAQAYNCSEPVKQYLNLWAFTSACNDYGAIPQALGTPHDQLAFGIKDLCEDPMKLLDSPMASSFPYASHIISAMLPTGDMNESLAALHARISNKEMRKTVGNRIAENFVRRFDYSKDFETGLNELKKAVSTYGVDERLVGEFSRRKSSAKGSAFPEGIVLVDAEGKTMDIAAFRGSYVYIDLWASWCGPCCKEVPYLQQLEKDMQGSPVKFVSISLDQDVNAWKNKMKALNMHGNQWHDKNNALGRALNVQGIPRFLIYDKEGRLYVADAPRPSHPATKEYLEKLK